MLRKFVAALIALAPATAVTAQTVATALDFNTAQVMPGSWGYQSTAGGSMARFVDTAGTARLVLECTKATRRVSVSLTSSAPAASLSLWTSIASRNMPARFEANAMRVTAELPAYDPLLDAIAFSRARIAVTMPGGVPLVVPSSPEAARTVEDCRI
jgi:urea transporter